MPQQAGGGGGGGHSPPPAGGGERQPGGGHGAGGQGLLAAAGAAAAVGDGGGGGGDAGAFLGSFLDRWEPKATAPVLLEAVVALLSAAGRGDLPDAMGRPDGAPAVEAGGIGALESGALEATM